MTSVKRFFPTQGPGAVALAALHRVREPLYVMFQDRDFTSPGDFHKLDRFPEEFSLVFARPGIRIYYLKG